jgi:hypothetical protein
MSLAADTNLAEGLSLHEELEPNNLKSLMYPAGTQRPTISKTEGQNLPIIIIIIIIIIRMMIMMMKKKIIIILLLLCILA